MRSEAISSHPKVQACIRKFVRLPVVNISGRLRERLGDEAAEDLAALINRATEDVKQYMLVLAGDRRPAASQAGRYERRLSEEIAQVNQNILAVRSGLEQRITEVEARLEQRITQVQAALETQIERSRADVIRWMFISANNQNSRELDCPPGEIASR